MSIPTQGQILHCISDQVQRDTCLDEQSANDYAAGLLAGYRVASCDPQAVRSEIEARNLARLCVDLDRRAAEVA